MFYGALALFVVLITVLDQITKAMTVANIPLYAEVGVIDGFFHFTYIQNSGNIEGQTKKNNSKLQNLFGCEFKSRCKDLGIPQKEIENHTDKHCNNGRADKMNR